MLVAEAYEVSLFIFMSKGIILKVIRALSFCKLSNEMCFFFSLSVIRLTSFINWLKLICYSFLLAKQSLTGLFVV